MMKIDATGFSVAGTGRKINGDAFVIDRALGFYAVADTVGVLSGDTIPSFLVTGYMRDAIREATERGDTAWQHVLERAILRANDMMLQIRRTDPGRNRGTTLTCCLVRDAQVSFAHLGDSRAYLIDDGQISQMTRDETLAALLYEKSMITSSAALRHPGRNQVLNIIGAQSEIRVTAWTVNLAGAMKIVLCTDGVASVLAKEEILRMVAGRGKSFSSVARRLVEGAMSRGSHDDATAVVLRASLK
jgi:serine/threonine protein phosphatase PrpC